MPLSSIDRLSLIARAVARESEWSTPPRGGDRCAREDARVLRAGSSWDAREDARLRRERNAGWDIARMACEHGRSRGAIRSRLRLLDGGGGGKR